MAARTRGLAIVLTAVTAAGGCGTAEPSTSAPTAACATGAAVSQAPTVVAPRQEDRVWTEKDDNLAPVDGNAVERQYQRLEAVGAAYRDTFGGVVFDPVAGELTVRYVSTSDRPAFLEAVNGLARRPGNVPVRFAEVDQSLAAMQALAAELDDSRDWAGSAASCIHHVSFNQLDYELDIDASGAAAQLVEAVRARTGLTPGISISPHGIVPQ